MIEKQVKSLYRWRKGSYIVFSLILLLFGLNLVANLLYTPKKDIVLLERDSRLYQVGDLTLPSISNGEVRQLVFDVFNEQLEFDHISFAKEADYKKRFSGQINKDVQDSRDDWRVWFTPRGFVQLEQQIANMPFMRNFYSDGKWVRTTVIMAPKSTNGVNASDEVVGKVNGVEGRLEYVFTGRLYFEVSSRSARDERFLVNYTVKIIRDDKPVSASSQKHFFKPLVTPNYTGMKIDSIAFTIGE